MDWHAHVTVATVIENSGRFLLVEELKGGRLVLNQPAGHLEPGESLIQAALRETLEETGWTVDIQGIVGVGLYTAPSNGVTYYRTTFFGTPLSHDPLLRLDDGDRACALAQRRGNPRRSGPATQPAGEPGHRALPGRAPLSTLDDLLKEVLF